MMSLAINREWVDTTLMPATQFGAKGVMIGGFSSLAIQLNIATPCLGIFQGAFLGGVAFSVAKLICLCTESTFRQFAEETFGISPSANTFLSICLVGTYSIIILTSMMLASDALFGEVIVTAILTAAFYLSVGL